MRANGKQTKGLEDLWDILWVGAVKPQRRQTQAADNKERVGHIVAKNSRPRRSGSGHEPASVRRTHHLPFRKAD